MAPTNKYPSIPPGDDLPGGSPRRDASRKDANDRSANDRSANDRSSSDNASAENSMGFSKLSPAEHSHRTVPVASAPAKRRKPIERKFNVSELIKMMYRGRWIILTTFVLAFAYSVYSTYSKPYIYGSSARMFIEKPPGGSQIAQIVGAPSAEDHSISNEMQFFKSNIVGGHVARLLHEYAMGDGHELDSLFLNAFGSINAIPPDPRQVAIIHAVDNPKLPSHPGFADTNTLEARASDAVNIAGDPSIDYLVVTSEGYTPIDAAFVANLYVACFVMDDQARVRANSAALKSYLFTQKERSFDTLRHVENKLRDYMGETNGMSAEDIAKGITAQYQELKQKRQLIEIDLGLRQKMYSDYTDNLDTVQKTYFDNLTLGSYVSMLQNTVAQKEFELESMKMANGQLDPRTKKYVKDEVESKAEDLNSWREKLRDASEKELSTQVIIAGEPSQYSGSEPVYSTKGSSASTITELRQSILNTKLRIGEDSTLLQNYDSKLAELHAEAATMPDKIVETSSLKRAEGVADKMYGQLEDRYLEAWMTEESAFGNVRAEDPASLNASPIRPNRQSSILTGSLLGLAFGIGIVVLLSFLDSTIRTPEEVESHNIQLLATIPVINHPSQPLSIEPGRLTAGGNLDIHTKFTPHRASHLDPRSSVAESYRSLRTTILFSGLDKDVQVLTLTSSAPQEGKSTTSSNLGIVMAQMGKRTLILDADLRRPVQHSVYGIEREPGLTNLLFERATFEEAIRETDVPNLYVLPCGIIPPNPAELLGSKRMAQLMDRLRAEFDFIILDSPPAVAVTDPLLLGHVADATLLVARADVSRIDAVLRTMDSIERSGAKLLGVVLNDFNAANAYGSYYKYYQYYHYYSDGPVKSKPWDLRRFLPSRKRQEHEARL